MGAPNSTVPSKLPLNVPPAAGALVGLAAGAAVAAGGLVGAGALAGVLHAATARAANAEGTPRDNRPAFMPLIFSLPVSRRLLFVRPLRWGVCAGCRVSQGARTPTLGADG